MKGLRYILVLILAGVLYSCGNSYDTRLVEIDSLATNGGAQRAVALLDSIESEELAKSDRMYFQLLRIKACDKAYIVHQSDSCLTDIINYFEHNDCAKLAEAYYYAGSVYRDLNDALQAVAYFQKCIDALPKDDHSRMKSNACFQCGDLYRQQCLKEQALEMINEAYRCDSVAGDTLRMADCLMQIGNIIGHDFCSAEVADKVLHYYNKAYDLACKTGNERMKADACVNFAFVYIMTGADEKAQPYLLAIADYLEKNPTDRLRFQYAELMSELLIKQSNYDAALPYCRELLGAYSIYHRQSANEKLHLIYSEKRDFAKAKHFLSELRNVTDSVRILTASENTAQANSLYNYQLRERDNLMLKAESQARLYTIFIFCAIFIAVLLAFRVYQMRQRQKQQMLHQQIARLRQLEKMQQGQNEVDIALQDLTRQKILESEVNEMLKQKLEKGKTLKADEIDIIDEKVNQICEGFKSTLFSAYNLSAQEYTVCLLLKFELSATDIGRLVGRTTSAITLLRKRLFRKLFGREGRANELDIYIRSL